jgi:ComF family protein
MLLPQACMLCTASNGGQLGLCVDCLKDLPWHNAAHCPQCALPALDNLHCGHCLNSPPDFDTTHALFRYEYPFDAMLQRFKYNQRLTIADTFGTLMANALQPATRPDVIIPMPLHPQRLKERGFNQSVELGRVLAKRLDIKLDLQSCVRIKFAPPQVSLPLKQRVKNMRGAFRCDNRLNGLRVALLDDVMTTGASLNALAKAVKKAGAAHVECWVLGRTLPR